MPRGSLRVRRVERAPRPAARRACRAAAAPPAAGRAGRRCPARSAPRRRRSGRRRGWRRPCAGAIDGPQRRGGRASAGEVGAGRLALLRPAPGCRAPDGEEAQVGGIGRDRQAGEPALDPQVVEVGVDRPSRPAGPPSRLGAPRPRTSCRRVRERHAAPMDARRRRRRARPAHERPRRPRRRLVAEHRAPAPPGVPPSSRTSTLGHGAPVALDFAMRRCVSA